MRELLATTVPEKIETQPVDIIPAQTASIPDTVRYSFTHRHYFPIIFLERYIRFGDYWPKALNAIKSLNPPPASTEIGDWTKKFGLIVPEIPDPNNDKTFPFVSRSEDYSHPFSRTIISCDFGKTLFYALPSSLLFPDSVNSNGINVNLEPTGATFYHGKITEITNRNEIDQVNLPFTIIKLTGIFINYESDNNGNSGLSTGYKEISERVWSDEARKYLGIREQLIAPVISRAIQILQPENIDL